MMKTELAAISSGMTVDDMWRLAEAVAKSGLFGMRTPEQAVVLMAVSQAEGRHPALCCRDFDIIQGRPAKKAEAMQRDFIAAGGKIEWLSLSDTDAKARFSHPQGGAVTIDWDMDRAAKAGLASKDNWRKFPRQMLRSRVISEGVRTIFPTATSGMSVPEEVDDFREPIDVTPPKEQVVAQVDQWRGERDGKTQDAQFEDVGTDIDKLLAQGNAVCKDEALLKLWWQTHLSAEQRGVLGAKGRGVGPYLPSWKDGKQVTKQVPPPLTVAEQPADETGFGGATDSPPADVFGLPGDDDEAFCNNMLKYVRDCATQEAVNNVKLTWSPGAMYYDHMERLPKPLWDNLMEQIGQHELSIRSAA